MRIITKAIREKLPSELIQTIWDFYDESYYKISKDEYQFFLIENKEKTTTLKMWQEEPSAMKIKSIPKFKECEVWIINDGDVLTMLFPEDY